MSTLMEKVAEVAPDKYQYLIKTAAEVKESPFREEILSELDMLIKRAGWMGSAGNMAGAVGRGAMGAMGAAGKAMAGPMGGVAAATAAGIAYALAGDMYDATKRGILKGRHYRSMLAENPDLKELPAHSVQKAFSVLHRFNPDFASDPTVAGTWVRRQSQFSEDQLGDFETVGKLVGSRKNLVDVKRLPQVPQTPGKKSPPMELSQKDRNMLGDLHAGLGDIDSRLGQMGQSTP